MAEPTFNKSWHRHWYTVLPAIPPSRKAIDWWAPTNDGRGSRYDRLKRYWFDRSCFKGPRSDCERLHSFSNPASGVYACVNLWENFTLFHPREFVPRLLDAANIEYPESVADACWSYGFEDESTEKKPDLLMHIRAESGSELLLVIEAKANGDTLKEGRVKTAGGTPRDTRPDANPATYRDLRSLSVIPNRKMLYLVRKSYTQEVREKVSAHSSDFWILTWPHVVELQLRLIAEVLEEDAAWIARSVIIRQAQRLSIEASENLDADPVSPKDVEIAISKHTEWSTHVQQWMKGAAFYLAALEGTVPTNLPFPYLASELSFPEIHLLPKGARQTVKEQRVSLWRLPASEIERLLHAKS